MIYAPNYYETFVNSHSDVTVDFYKNRKDMISIDYLFYKYLHNRIFIINIFV